MKLKFRRVERNIIALAIPLIINNILFTLMGFVDALMVGQLGEDTISAVGNSAQVQMFLFLIFAAIGQGGSILIAQYFGAGDEDNVRATTSTTIGAGVFIGLIVGGATYFFGDTFIWLLTLGKSPEVVRIGARYLRIISFSYALSVPGNMIAASLRAVGDTKTAVYIAVAANALNIFGNWLLIFGIGPFPEMGYAGAAVSTLISQILQALALIGFTLTRHSKLRFKLSNLFKIVPERLKAIVRIGYPMSVDGFYWQGARIAYTVIFNAIGSHAYAAYTIVRNLKGMATLPTSGLNTATMITVGQELGKNNKVFARLKAYTGLRMSVIIMTIPAVLVIALAGPFVSLFKIAPVTWNEAFVCTMILGVSIFFTTINSVIPGILRAGGDTVYVMKVTLLSFLFVGGPLAFLLGIVFHFGTIGAFVGISLEEVFKAWVFERRMKKGYWLKKII